MYHAHVCTYMTCNNDMSKTTCMHTKRRHSLWCVQTISTRHRVKVHVWYMYVHIHVQHMTSMCGKTSVACWLCVPHVYMCAMWCIGSTWMCMWTCITNIVDPCIHLLHKHLSRYTTCNCCIFQHQKRTSIKYFCSSKIDDFKILLYMYSWKMTNQRNLHQWHQQHANIPEHCVSFDVCTSFVVCTHSFHATSKREKAEHIDGKTVYIASECAIGRRVIM